MATTSELDKIRRNPIKERLAAFRHRFESTRSALDVSSSLMQCKLSFRRLSQQVLLNFM
jgi:hypothetical protein